MRVLSENITKAISEFQSFIYCFHIILQDGTNIYLTESDKFIKLGICPLFWFIFKGRRV